MTGVKFYANFIGASEKTTSKYSLLKVEGSILYFATLLKFDLLNVKKCIYYCKKYQKLLNADK